MTMMVKVDADVLREHLQCARDIAQAQHSRYDRKTKKYPWNDAIWKECDPYRYGLYDRLRSALNGSAPR